jgi:hypothetical protein
MIVKAHINFLESAVNVLIHQDLLMDSILTSRYEPHRAFYQSPIFLDNIVHSPINETVLN